MDSSDLQGRLVRVPAGQASPLHRTPADTIFVALAGEVEFTVGEDRALLKPFDLMQIPGDAPRSYFNFGLTDAIFFAVQARPPQGQPYEVIYRQDELEAGWTAPDDLDVTHLKWEDYRRQIIYRGGLVHQFGSHRGVFPHIQATSMKGHVVRVPGGQSSPWHTVGGDVTFVGLHGEIEVYADKEVYSLGPLDVLVLPPPMYALQNVGLSDGLYFSINAKSPTPTKIEYFEPAVLGDPLAGPGASMSL
ncbi:cupin domain-containing protein [Rhodococcus koreensis]